MHKISNQLSEYFELTVNDATQKIANEWDREKRRKEKIYNFNWFT